MPSDFILTLDSDGEDDTSSKDAGLTLDPGFVFDLGGGMLDDLGEEQDVVKSGSKPVRIALHFDSEVVYANGPLFVHIF
jgi:hypothetical protein